MRTLIIATRNAHKVGEIRSILGPGFEFRTLHDYSHAPAVVEDSNTFAGNAAKKAVELARHLSRHESALTNEEAFVLADDSGLEVDALNGAPGVHSARFAALDSSSEELIAHQQIHSQTKWESPLPAAGNCADADNNVKLLRLLKDCPAERRTARFRCVIALTPLFNAAAHGASATCGMDEHELAIELFEGTCEGRISVGPSGGKGFGYDPLFVPHGYKESFAELGEEVKNRISHRARALEKLRARLARR